MNWLFQAFDLKPPQFQESLINCHSCQVRLPLKRKEAFEPASKCCQFSPFWSCFAVGAWLESQNKLEPVQESFILTPLGILHSLPHRRSTKSLCSHFDSSRGSCRIWSQRPATCFSFFCASEHSMGLKRYEAMERKLLDTEAELLRAWFFHLGLDDHLWQAWAEYMEEDPKLKVLPKSLVLQDLKQAVPLYQKSWQWLQAQPAHQLLKLGWEKHLAQ